MHLNGPKHFQRICNNIEWRYQSICISTNNTWPSQLKWLSSSILFSINIALTLHQTSALLIPFPTDTHQMKKREKKKCDMWHSNNGNLVKNITNNLFIFYCNHNGVRKKMGWTHSLHQLVCCISHATNSKILTSQLSVDQNSMMSFQPLLTDDRLFASIV